jgi:hypothetical protein
MRHVSVLITLCGIFGLVSQNAVAASSWQMDGDNWRADKFESIKAKIKDRKSNSAKLDRKLAKKEQKLEKIIQYLEWNYESRPEDAEKVFSWDDVDSFYGAWEKSSHKFTSEDGKFAHFKFGKHKPDLQSLAINNPKFAEYFQTQHPELYGVTAAAVPIPASVWLFGSALAGLGWARRRKSVV